MKKDIIIISGQSGAGKGTLIGELLKKYPDTFYYVKSTTTRKLRKTKPEADQDRKRYNVVTRKEFEIMEKQDAFIETAVVHGYFYGKTKAEFEKASKSKKTAIVEIDVCGMKAVKEEFGDRVVTIFITVPSVQELEKRLRLRGSDTEEEIQTRLKTAKEEEKYISEYDHVVVNDKIPQAVVGLEQIIFGKKIGYR